MNLAQVAAALRRGEGEVEIVAMSGELLQAVAEARGLPPSIWTDCLHVIADDTVMKAESSWRLVDTIGVFWDDMRPHQQAEWSDALTVLFRDHHHPMLSFTIAEFFGSHLGPCSILERLVPVFHESDVPTRTAIVHSVGDALRRARGIGVQQGSALRFLREASVDDASEVREEANRALRELRE